MAQGRHVNYRLDPMAMHTFGRMPRARHRPVSPNASIAAMSCTQCAGVEQQFDSGAAKKSLRRFRRRGPDRTTRLLIDALRAALESSGARDTVLLDVGAGIG